MLAKSQILALSNSMLPHSGQRMILCALWSAPPVISVQCSTRLQEQQATVQGVMQGKTLHTIGLLLFSLLKTRVNPHTREG